MNQTTILVNGEMPTHPTGLKALADAKHLVCTDGAYHMVAKLGCEVQLVVGDGDSLSESDKRALGDRWLHIAEQDTNDLDKAFRTVLSRFPETDKIVILGASGLREDHFLGNLFRLPGFAKRAPGVDVEMITNAGTFTVVQGRREYACAPNEPVSVFAPGRDTHVSSGGLHWPLDGVALDELWAGTLNRTTGTSFTLESNKAIMVYRPHTNAI